VVNYIRWRTGKGIAEEHGLQDTGERGKLGCIWLWFVWIEKRMGGGMVVKRKLVRLAQAGLVERRREEATVRLVWSG